jgi:hypothetical protein
MTSLSPNIMIGAVTETPPSAMQGAGEPGETP